MRNYLVLAIGVAATALCTPASAFGGLLTDGNFEDFTGTGSNQIDAGANYWAFGVGSDALPGWTINGRTGIHPDVSIDVVNGPYDHHDNYGVDLAGSPGPGSISQSVATGAGSYVLSFYASYTGDIINSHLDLEFGSYHNTFLLDSSPFHQYSVTITPGSGGSTLFRLGTDVLNGTNGNEFIDDVQIQAVPEPFTMSLVGCSALAAFIRMRRKQKAQ